MLSAEWQPCLENKIKKTHTCSLMLISGSPSGPLQTESLSALSGPLRFESPSALSCPLQIELLIVLFGLLQIELLSALAAAWQIESPSSLSGPLQIELLNALSGLLLIMVEPLQQKPSFVVYLVIPCGGVTVNKLSE